MVLSSFTKVVAVNNKQLIQLYPEASNLNHRYIPSNGQMQKREEKSL